VSTSVLERADAPVASSQPPPLSVRLQLVRAVLLLVMVLSLTLVIQLVVVSRLQHSASQGRAFDSFRGKLAEGTAPVGPNDGNGVQLPLGTGVAYLEIRTIDLQEVVLEGSTPSVLFEGAGHRRDTPLPGQVGTSVVLGRRAAYGGPFGDLGDLRKGDIITATTGQGVFDYTVIGTRRDGDPQPPPLARNSARLTLVTAAGTPFLPDGVFYVDADITSTPTGGDPRAVTATTLPMSERPMGTDSSTLWALALWLQALIVLSVGAVWAWHRWSRPATWIVFLPPLALVGLAASGELARLLPNLL
jgi:sortase A